VAQKVVSAGGSVDASVENGLAMVVLNQPARRNAMTLAMWEALGETVRQLDEDPSARVAVIRGAGTESFSAGADITEFEELRSTPDKALAYNKRVGQAVHKLLRARKPLIAMIHGFCVGGGCEIALSCDLRIAADHAVLAFRLLAWGLATDTTTSSVWLTWSVRRTLS
jgi:enoyl-CoA hydratase